MNKKLGLVEFFERFPTEEAAEKHFIKMRWGEEITCPFCNSLNVVEKKNRLPMPYRCKDCRKHFSVRTGTILSESKLPLQKWLLAMFIMTTSHKGISSIQFAEELGCTQKTAWFLAHRIRETWIQSKNQLYGIVEVDETYIGGKETNKHESKKLNSGRGSVGKIPVVGAKSREGDIRARVVKSTTAKTLEKFVINNIDTSSILYTDQHGGYINLGKIYEHGIVNHSIKEYVRGTDFTNGIESFWALLKRSYYGIYHNWSSKHLQRYVDECVERANTKNIELNEKIMLTFAKGINRRLSYKELINNK